MQYWSFAVFSSAVAPGVPSAGIASPASVAAVAASRQPRPDGESKVPWYLWVAVLGINAIEIGGIWDFSWHRSIGRDTFWTPAHIAIQLGGITAALICVRLIVATTFGGSPKAKAASVRVLGFRGPLGAFLAAWGGLTMAVSAAFDDWWHSAYGLDVKIVSPPHAVLIFGIHCVAAGILMLVLSFSNRAAAAGSPAARMGERLYLYMGGLILMSQMFFVIQYLGNSALHTARPYKGLAAVLPIVLVALSQGYRSKWTATVAASIYTSFYIAAILILPLFPAEPKLGPVFYPVTHMVPSNFPILVLVPAILLDLLYRRIRNARPAVLALATGVVFIAGLVAVEWPFASFLMTKWAANRFFGTIYFDFSTRIQDTAQVFASPESGLHLAAGLLQATAVASFGAWVGVYLGRWMRSVRR